MKKTLLLITLNITLVAATLAGLSPTQADSGVRGGGESKIDLNGKPELLELVNGLASTCQWVNGKDYSEKPAIKPHFEKAFTRLSSLDPRFAADLKKEVHSLQFCRTGALTKDLIFLMGRFSDILSPVYKNSKLAAFRLNDEVYVDAELADAHSPRSQAYLLVHEAMHSYIPYRLPFRQLKLRSAVKVIDDVDLGTITSTSELHRLLDLNGVWYPFSSLLPPGSSDFESFIHLSDEEKITWSYSRHNLAGIFKSNLELKEKLGKKVELFEPWVSKPFETLTSLICGSEQTHDAITEHLFSDLKQFPYANSSLPLICLGSLSSKSDRLPKILKMVGSESDLKTQINAYLTRVMGRGFIVRGNRLSPNALLAEFFGVDSQPYTAIKQTGRSVELSGLTTLYMYLVNSKKTDDVNEFFWNNVLFQRVVSLYDLAPKAAATQPPVEREVRHSQIQSPILFSQLMLGQAQTVAYECGVDAGQEFVTKLMNLNPGFFVNKNLVKENSEVTGDRK
jgi:hypothetical protein